MRWVGGALVLVLTGGLAEAQPPQDPIGTWTCRQSVEGGVQTGVLAFEPDGRVRMVGHYTGHISWQDVSATVGASGSWKVSGSALSFRFSSIGISNWQQDGGGGVNHLILRPYVNEKQMTFAIDRDAMTLAPEWGSNDARSFGAGSCTRGGTIEDIGEVVLQIGR